MINNTPTISVIMPVYNTERYVREAIGSILNQTFADFEFLIFDDGSTDKSLAIINSFDDKRIKVIHSAVNKGYIYHLNEGIRLASGSYIARMDADDISLPQRFAKQIELLATNAKLIGCSTNMRYMNENGVLGDIRWNEKTPVFIPWELLWDNPICHPSIMVRSEILKKEQYDTKLRPTEDYEMWIRISKFGILHRINEVFIHYRKLDKSEYHSNTNNVFHLALEINDTYIRQLVGIPANFHKELTNFWYYLGNSYPTLLSIKNYTNWLLRLKYEIIRQHSPNQDEVELINSSIYSKIIHKIRMQESKQKMLSLLYLFTKINMVYFIKYYKSVKSK